MRQPIRRLVFDNANLEDVREKSLALGMRTLRECGIEKVKRGVTTLSEVMRITVQEF
jgi:type II secretory ATPase GspE/PulE/Tfp pilus assembly ATPase PilB-like protein